MNYQKTEVRAIDHIGITIPDIEQAAKFLEEAFGATAIYDTIIPSDPPMKGKESEEILGYLEGTAITHMRLMRIGDGPCIELFKMKVLGNRKENIIPSDIGLQHFAVYTEDIEETKRTAAICTAEEKAACNKVDRTNSLSTNSNNDLGITHHHKETGHNFRFGHRQPIGTKGNSLKGCTSMPTKANL